MVSESPRMKEPTILSMSHLADSFKPRKMLFYIILGVFLAGLPLLGGCIFSPDRGHLPPPDPPLQYLKPTTPQRVFNNLIKSYTERDSTHYKACFDSLSYAGYSYNGFDGDPPQPDTYSFDDEAMHISALQRSTVILHVSLDLPNYSGAPMDTLAGDPLGWVTINIQRPRVQIDDVSGSVALVSGEIFEYKFEPTIVSTDISDTGKLWKIIRWREISP